MFYNLQMVCFNDLFLKRTESLLKTGILGVVAQACENYSDVLGVLFCHF